MMHKNVVEILDALEEKIHRVLLPVIYYMLNGTYDADENIVLDKTWNEINNASYAVITLRDTDYKSTSAVTTVFSQEGVYTVNDESGSVYTSDSANGYPKGDGGK